MTPFDTVNAEYWALTAKYQVLEKIEKDLRAQIDVLEAALVDLQGKLAAARKWIKNAGHQRRCSCAGPCSCECDCGYEEVMK